jgi:hypothetical protein
VLAGGALMDPAEQVAAEADAAATFVRDAVGADELDVVRLTLHPYLHWTTADGTVVRGRNQVLAMLSARSTLERPASVALRDGQVYRWVE